MSKLSDLRCKGEPLTLSNGLEIIIKPMTIGEEADIAILQKDNNVFGAVTTLVKGAIKRAIPDATDDEIEELNKIDLQTITKMVLKVNGLEGDEKPKKS